MIFKDNIISTIISKADGVESKQDLIYFIDNLFIFRQFFFDGVVIILAQDTKTYEYVSYIYHIDHSSCEDIVHDCVEACEYFDPNRAAEFFEVDLDNNYYENYRLEYAEEFI